jgi:hypothetical protein
MFRFILGFAFTFTTFVVSAGCSSNGCFGVFVDKLYVTSSGLIYIGTSGDETKLSCSAVSDVYTSLSITRPGANVIYSTLLSAQMANKLVTIRTSNDSSGCSIAYVTLDKQ